jgi:hypothetical protein
MRPTAFRPSRDIIRPEIWVAPRVVLPSHCAPGGSDDPASPLHQGPQSRPIDPAAASRPVPCGLKTGTHVSRLLPMEAHRDALVYLAQAASTGPPWLAIALAGIATLSAVGVAMAPALVERVKRGRVPAAPAATQPASEGSVDLVREALADARQERDEAQAEVKDLGKQLAAAQREVALRDVEIAKQAARIEHLTDRLGRGSA